MLALKHDSNDCRLTLRWLGAALQYRVENDTEHFESLLLSPAPRHLHAWLRMRLGRPLSLKGEPSDLRAMRDPSRHICFQALSGSGDQRLSSFRIAHDDEQKLLDFLAAQLYDSAPQQNKPVFGL